MAKVVEAVEAVRREIPSHANDSATEAERQALRRMDKAWQTGIASLSRANADKAAARLLRIRRKAAPEAAKTSASRHPGQGGANGGPGARIKDAGNAKNFVRGDAPDSVHDA